MKRRPRTQERDARMVEGARWCLIDEVRYIQRRAAAHESRIVTIGPLVLFSTDTGDAWVLDPAERLARPVAREGDPLPVQIEENDTRFTIDWTGRYRIDGRAFVFDEKDSGVIRAILGYPTRHIAEHSRA